MPYTIIIVGRGLSAAAFPVCYAQARAQGSVDVYTLNHHRQAEATHHFEIHWPRHHDTADLQHLPVIVHPEATRAANERHFPRDEIRARFGLTPTNDMLGCTIAWMIAYACLQDPGQLMLPGCDNYDEADPRYRQARRCCEAWIFLARGLGIKLWIPDNSMLLATEDYR